MLTLTGVVWSSGGAIDPELRCMTSDQEHLARGGERAVIGRAAREQKPMWCERNGKQGRCAGATHDRCSVDAAAGQLDGLLSDD